MGLPTRPWWRQGLNLLNLAFLGGRGALEAVQGIHRGQHEVLPVLTCIRAGAVPIDICGPPTTQNPLKGRTPDDRKEHPPLKLVRCLEKGTADELVKPQLHL